MDSEQQNEYMKAKEQLRELYETVKSGKLEDIKKIIDKMAKEQKDEDNHSIRIKNLINDTKVCVLLAAVYRF